MSDFTIYLNDADYEELQRRIYGDLSPERQAKLAEVGENMAKARQKLGYEVEK